MEAWEVLERAAALIERGFWRQGDGGSDFYGNPITGHCAFTSIGACSFPSWETHEAASDALCCALGGPTDDRAVIWQWNDAPGRTKEEVCAMLRAVSASLRAAARTAGTRQHVAASTDAGVDSGHAALMERMS